MELIVSHCYKSVYVPKGSSIDLPVAALSLKLILKQSILALYCVCNALVSIR